MLAFTNEEFPPRFRPWLLFSWHFAHVQPHLVTLVPFTIPQGENQLQLNFALLSDSLIVYDVSPAGNESVIMDVFLSKSRVGTRIHDSANETIHEHVRVRRSVHFREAAVQYSTVGTRGSTLRKGTSVPGSEARVSDAP